MLNYTKNPHPTHACPACGVDLKGKLPQEPTDECGAEFNCFKCKATLYECGWPLSEVGIHYYQV